MTIVTVGIDLAKNVFAVHGVDAGGRPALLRLSVARRHARERSKLAERLQARGRVVLIARPLFRLRGHMHACLGGARKNAPLRLSEQCVQIVDV